jgi:hypothetical protein
MKPIEASISALFDKAAQYPLSGLCLFFVANFATAEVR